MFHTTLSKGKHIALRKKERYIIRAQVKETGKYCVIRAQAKGTGKYYVIRAQVKGTGNYCMIVQVKRTGRYIIRAQVKGTGKYCKPTSKDRVTNQANRQTTDLENQSHKTGSNTSI